MRQPNLWVSGRNAGTPSARYALRVKPSSVAWATSRHEVIKATPEIPREVKGMRIVAAYAYYRIDYEEVWVTLRDDVPRMAEAVKRWRQAQASRPDAWASGMQCDMGEGRVVYLLVKGKAGRPEQVSTHGSAPVSHVGTVDDQDRQHDQWLLSRRNRQLIGAGETPQKRKLALAQIRALLQSRPWPSRHDLPCP